MEGAAAGAVCSDFSLPEGTQIVDFDTSEGLICICCLLTAGDTERGQGMGFETLTYDVAEGVGTITINRPEAANAMSPQCAAEFSEVAILCDDDPAVRAVVLTGAGKMFCAGGDLGAFAAAGAGAKSLLKKMTGDLHLGLKVAGTAR